jgi:hypothetical protein
MNSAAQRGNNSKVRVIFNYWWVMFTFILCFRTIEALASAHLPVALHVSYALAYATVACAGFVPLIWYFDWRKR